MSLRINKLLPKSHDCISKNKFGNYMHTERACLFHCIHTNLICILFQESCASIAAICCLQARHDKQCSMGKQLARVRTPCDALHSQSGNEDARVHYVQCYFKTVTLPPLLRNEHKIIRLHYVCCYSLANFLKYINIKPLYTV